MHQSDYYRYMKKARDSGIEFHREIEKILKGEKDYDPTVHPLFYQLAPVMKRISKVHYVEQKIHHSLGYAGRCDAVLTLDDKVTVVDWKSKKNPLSRNKALKEFCQLTAYAHALDEMNLITPEQVAIIFVVDKPSRRAAGVFTLQYPNELKVYWETFRKLINQFYKGMPF